MAARGEPSAQNLFGHEGAAKRIGMAERHEAAGQIMGADGAGSWLWEHADRASLADHRLLLDVEAHALHVRQYDFGREQSIPNVLGACVRSDRHRGLHRQRAVRRAHKAAQVAPHPQLPAEVAGDRTQVGPAPAADLHPRDGLGSRRKVEHVSLVYLHLPRGRLRLLAAAREAVRALALDLDRREGRRLLEDAAGEVCQGLGDSGDRQAARIAVWNRLCLGVVGSGRKAQVDVGHVCLGELMRELGEAGRGFKKDGQHAAGQRIQSAAPAARMWPPPPNDAHNAAASTAPRLRTLIFVKSDETSLKRMASSSPAMLLRVSMMPSDSAITATASRSIRRVTFAQVSFPWSSMRIVARARALSFKVVSGRIL